MKPIYLLTLCTLFFFLFSSFEVKYPVKPANEQMVKVTKTKKVKQYKFKKNHKKQSYKLKFKKRPTAQKDNAGPLAFLVL